ncbi:MAG: hypothetical protein AABW59_03440 [archaeon]
MPELKRRPSAFSRMQSDLHKRQDTIKKVMSERLGKNRQKGAATGESYRRMAMQEREKELRENKWMLEDPEVEYAIERVAQQRELVRDAKEVADFRRTNGLLIEEIERMLKQGMGTNRGMSGVFAKNVSVMIALTLHKQLGTKLMQLRYNSSALREIVSKINYSTMVSLQGIPPKQMIAMQRNGQMQQVVAQASEEVLEEMQGQ